MKQGYNARLNESMGMRNRRTMKKATMNARRSESRGMEKKMGRRAYAAVRTMDRKRKRRGGMSCKRGGKSCKRGGKKRMTFLQRLGF